MIIDFSPANDLDASARHRRSTARVSLLIVCALAMLSHEAAFAQEPQPTLAFDVASVKANTSAGPADLTIRPGGYFAATRMPLRDLIALAYLGRLTQPRYLLIGGEPDWTRAVRFDIVAKANRELTMAPDGPPPEVPAMLRRLLEERFAVKARHEIRTLPAYALVVENKNGKLGPSLRPTAVPCTPTTPDVRPENPENACGIRTRRTDATAPNLITLVGRGVTMTQFAERLQTAPVINRPVEDRTLLAGPYDFTVEFTPPAANATQSPGQSPGTLLPAAIEDQLGLTLQPVTAAVDVVVIDAISRLIPD